MRKVLTAALAALTVGGSIAATATPAAAQHAHWSGHTGGGHWSGGHWGGRGGYYGGHYHGDNDDWAWGLGAGLAGFALGAAVSHPYYNDGYYGGYYGPGYGYGYGYGTCVGTRRVWDPYYGGWVIRRFYYDC
jgi:hypothetical protein